MDCFNQRYRGRRVLVTGHTGFKGSWLVFWLRELGAEIHGVSLPAPTKPSHCEVLSTDVKESIIDIRDADAVSQSFQEFQPEIVFHLAAQPLVRRSYREPIETFSTNLMGTLNVYEACLATSSVQAVVSITSDKVYENRESSDGYSEDARLGGSDPYSCSKACVELATKSYFNSFFNDVHLGRKAPLLSTVRAGNVIGGGDWAEDRIVVDAVVSASNGNQLEIRNPNAVRPWQHVLEPLSGYLLVGQTLLEGDSDKARPWNFGPDDQGEVSVGQLAERLKQTWSKINPIIAPEENAPKETSLLKLDSSEAKGALSWKPIWSWETAVERTAEWYRRYYESQECNTAADLSAYVERAMQESCVWA